MLAQNIIIPLLLLLITFWGNFCTAKLRKGKRVVLSLKSAAENLSQYPLATANGTFRRDDFFENSKNGADTDTDADADNDNDNDNEKLLNYRRSLRLNPAIRYSAATTKTSSTSTTSSSTTTSSTSTTSSSTTTSSTSTTSSSTTTSSTFTISLSTTTTFTTSTSSTLTTISSTTAIFTSTTPSTSTTSLSTKTTFTTTTTSTFTTSSSTTSSSTTSSTVTKPSSTTATTTSTSSLPLKTRIEPSSNTIGKRQGRKETNCFPELMARRGTSSQMDLSVYEICVNGKWNIETCPDKSIFWINLSCCIESKKFPCLGNCLSPRHRDKIGAYKKD